MLGVLSCPGDHRGFKLWSLAAGLRAVICGERISSTSQDVFGPRGVVTGLNMEKV